MWRNCDHCGEWAWSPLSYRKALDILTEAEIDTAPLLIFEDDVQAYVCRVCGALGFAGMRELRYASR